MSASPESLSRMREKAGARPSGAPLPSLETVTAAALLLADREAHEAADDHVLAGTRRSLRPELLDRLALVLVGVHVRLVEQHHLLEPLAHASLGDLGAN